MEIIDMLTKGYFPEELTPPFTTEDLQIVYTEVYSSIDNFDPVVGNRKVITKMTNFSIPKIKGYRRNLGIPVPFHFMRLAKTIVDNWDDIERHCNRSSISLSRLKLRIGTARSILKPSFKNTVRERIIRSTGNRFLLKIDIAKFYSSIYTHSLPWAIHSKLFAKSNRKRTSYGNALDEDCRKMQDGQTIGIPIGPDTSRVLSEIILSSIDLEIENSLGYIEGLRVVDDYHLYFKTLGDLEKARVVIHKALKEYELELNQSKENVIELPDVIESKWISEIREFKFRNRRSSQRTDLISYFDIVIAHSRKFPEEMVLPYAMAKLRFTVFYRANWLVFQSLLLNALLIEPKILPFVAQNLLSYHGKGYSVDVNLVSSSLEQFIIYHCNLDNDFEIIWALWTAKSLGITLSEEIAKVLSSNDNALVILTALDLNEHGFLPNGLNKTFWESLLTAENLSNRYWLVAYEAKRKGWLNSPTDYFAANPFFKILDDNNVSFYKEGRVLDLTMVKVNSEPSYFGNEEEREDSSELESVYTSVNRNLVENVIIVNANLSEHNDLPF